MVNARRELLFRVGNKKSQEPHHFLHRAVRVIKKCSFLMYCEFVRELLAGPRRFLADPRHAVLFDRHL